MWNMGGLGFELFGMISECAVPSPRLVVVRVGVSRETFGGCGGWEWFHVKHLPPMFMVGYGVGFYCDD